MSNIAIVYISKYGHTKTYVDWLKEELSCDTFIGDKIDFTRLIPYKLVIFASGVYNDKIQIMDNLKKNIDSVKIEQTMIMGVSWYVSNSETAKTKLITDNYPDVFKNKVPLLVVNSGIDKKKISAVENVKLLAQQLMIEKHEDRSNDDINSLAIIKGYADQTSKENMAFVVEAVNNFLKPKPKKATSTRTSVKKEEKVASVSRPAPEAVIHEPKPIEPAKPVKQHRDENKESKATADINDLILSANPAIIKTRQPKPAKTAKPIIANNNGFEGIETDLSGAFIEETEQVPEKTDEQTVYPDNNTSAPKPDVDIAYNNNVNSSKPDEYIQKSENLQSNPYDYSKTEISQSEQEQNTVPAEPERKHVPEPVSQPVIEQPAFESNTYKDTVTETPDFAQDKTSIDNKESMFSSAISSLSFKRADKSKQLEETLLHPDSIKTPSSNKVDNSSDSFLSKPLPPKPKAESTTAPKIEEPTPHFAKPAEDVTQQNTQSKSSLFPDLPHKKTTPSINVDTIENVNIVKENSSAVQENSFSKQINNSFEPRKTNDFTSTSNSNHFEDNHTPEHSHMDIEDSFADLKAEFDITSNITHNPNKPSEVKPVSSPVKQDDIAAPQLEEMTRNAFAPRNKEKTIVIDDIAPANPFTTKPASNSKQKLSFDKDNEAVDITFETEDSAKSGKKSKYYDFSKLKEELDESIKKQEKENAKTKEPPKKGITQPEDADMFFTKRRKSDEGIPGEMPEIKFNRRR